MNKKLEEKMLLLRARHTYKNLSGIDKISFDLNIDNTTASLMEGVNSLNKIENINKSLIIPHPIIKDELIKKLIMLSHKTSDFSCCFIFEGELKVSASGYDFNAFLSSIIDIDGTYDINIILENPIGILSVIDNEYDIHIYYKEIGL
ncbi:hypothetical protein [Candidatus Pantoea multigeneris]|uniref:Uncharacterized protein n=1 Tax=Candidatus Pantoea multigeneris TaxID=2608357 RepID=A0ABX0RDH5_9GAMM|nr:hypothetical protein [Pantoea multigeneris]NIF23097.1 hypothetical protein [Pantoea multigeneris]